MMNAPKLNIFNEYGFKEKIFPIFCSLLLCLTVPTGIKAQGRDRKSGPIVYFPSKNAKNVNPDTHLKLTFPGKPIIGHSGQIRIYDASDDKLVDLLDMSIPAGPTKSRKNPSAVYSLVPYKYVTGNFTNANTRPGTPSGMADPTSDKYQLTIIGGFTDAFHFYPIIIHGNTATIYLHNNLLKYDKTYYVQIDPGVLHLKDGHFNGISGKKGWVFSTKKQPPPADSKRLVVSSDGNGDFNTVQGAIDFVPDHDPKPVTIYVKNGKYEEIVYFRNKKNITIQGQSRDSVIVYYPNNEVFNPHSWNIKTNEKPGTFPSRRAAFAVDHSNNIHLVNLTIKNTSRGQAEGLLLNGKHNIVSNVTIVGSGDALQSNGSAYYTDCHIIGDGDTILGRGPAFFYDCELNSYGAYMWIRNTSANHGNVFLDCKFQTRGGRETVIARAPANHGQTYPYCEAVLLNCSLEGISPKGWGPVGGVTKNIHYWEYNSTYVKNGKPVDVSKRSPVSRQLTMHQDSSIISDYEKPDFVLGGWEPAMVPIILKQPESLTLEKGKTAVLSVKIAAVPKARLQWYKDGKPIPGNQGSKLILKDIGPSDAATYMVKAKNGEGSIISHRVRLKVL